MAVLEHLGIADYFLYPQISWEAKSAALEHIASALNIGIDALALVDDSAFERNEVGAGHPQVRTYHETQVGSLTGLPEFDVPATAESKTRRAMYRAEERRSALMAAEKTDITDFLRRCNLRIRVFEPGTEEERLRCYELVVRTNQLNMSGVKYTPEEFEAVLARPAHRHFAFSCADDFGEYGIVGFGQYGVENGTLVFTEFAMSCRVAGKFVESALFAHLLEVENCKSGIFAVQKTKKNILLRNSLESIGFVSEEVTAENVCYHFTAELKNNNVIQLQK
jgi:FkbH-like protein